ncbi:MAG TPA: hypothetical protein VK400_14870 [Pyrinomonadaceae bacterium]|nr:hypothetical protein [Pyrinomonadaceae bacterium]
MLILSISAFGQESALEKMILINPGNYEIDVFVQPSSLSGWNNKTKWVVIAIASDGSVNKLAIDDIRLGEPDKTEKNNSMFTIVPDAASKNLIKDAAKIIVNFGSKVITLPPINSPAANQGGDNGTPFGAAANKQNADVYLNGSYSPGINGGDPQYSVDGSISVMFDIDKNKTKYGQLGFVGSVKTDKRKKVDPDSYRLFLAYQNVPSSQRWGALQGVQFTWLAAGTEFDRKGKNINFISAPYLDFPILLYPETNRRPDKPLAVLTPTIGFETGWNFRNAVTPNQGRGIFRGVAGADLLFRFNPKISGFQGVEFTNSYMMRIPATKEIYTLTRKENGQDVDVPFLNKKPRHYIKSELGLKLNDYFSITTKYEYGMLPPVFRRIEHKLSFGFTFSARQEGFGVPSVIRNK